MAASSSSASTNVNRLSSERSPYLLQHATNPVEWFPWGEEAFARARNENKPIFLSVGYSTCHWCHVMERESFESVEVAAIMNANFVNVKVDREERPDVDKVYMSFVQALTGGGGWPMSVFLTPELKPFYGGTYFPPEDSYGRPGFKSLLRSIAAQWESKNDDFREAGDSFTKAIADAAASEASSRDDSSVARSPAFAEGVAKKCFAQLLQRYDPEMGGFSRSPKFPSPPNMNFLFRIYAEDPSCDRSKQALKMCLLTLEMISLGGINDHVSKGVARYSTDGSWHVPHFEKMLYDQAQLTVSFSQAFQATGDERFGRAVDDIIEYVNRDMRHAAGGYYSAEDADSYPEEGASGKLEGAFCVWKKREIEELLGGEQISNQNKDGDSKSLADLVCAYFHVKDSGNCDPSKDPHGELKGVNVLTAVGTDRSDIMADFGIAGEAELDAYLERARKVLFEARLKRPRPHLDDKILTSWNALMISGLCHAGAARDRTDYIEKARETASFVRENLYESGNKTLLRSIYTSKSDAENVEQIAAPIRGFVDDYAFMVRALLDLYEITFDSAWIEWAAELQRRQDELFWDQEGGGYFTSDISDTSIVVRMKEDQDGAEPASNSVAASNLLRLSSFLDKPDCKEKAMKIFEAFSERLAKIPMALPEMASALVFNPSQIIITGPTDRNDNPLLDLVHRSLVPSMVLIHAGSDEDSILRENLAVLKDIPSDTACKAYVCKDFTCSPPVSEVEELRTKLGLDQK